MEAEKSLQIDAIRTRGFMQERLVESAASTAFLRDPDLQARVRDIWLGSDEDGGCASELFVEGTFPAEDGGASVDDLVAAGTFSGALRDQLARSGRFPTSRPLYRHQREAVEIGNRRDGPRPVIVVSAGTGMGKTEAFLLPLLNELHSRPPSRPRDGVRAIVLYPMNALVNDQVERLHGWLKGQSDCRLFHFTGETPEDDRAADKANYPRFDDGSRLRTRQEARANPPDVLITNYSMLEYMLIRPQDAPFFGKDLSVFVLDEMHLYSGTLAAEIALLLRRVLLRCGRRPEEVLFLGASATLGGRLEDFSAALFSRSAEDVRVIEGRRARPTLLPPDPPIAPVAAEDVPDPLPDTPFLDQDGLVDDPETAAAVAAECARLAGAAAQEAAARHRRPAQALAEILSRAPLMRRVQDLLWDATSRRDILPLDRMSRDLWGRADQAARRATERVLRLGARARWRWDELPLFPHKIHFLVRSPVAPMACVNPDCSHASGHRLPGAGPVLSGSRETCPACASQTLPLARCRSCGEWFLAATHSGKDNRFRPLRDWDERDQPEDDEERAGDLRSRLFLRPAAPDAESWVPYQLSDGRREILGPHVRLADHSACPCCGEAEFGLVQFADEQGIGLAAETMLAAMPPWPDGGRACRPAAGRRLIAFSDTRQSAARLGPSLTATHEAQMCRAMIADCLREGAVNEARLRRLRRQEASLAAELEEAEGDEREAIRIDLERCRADLRAALSGGDMGFWLERLRSHPLVAELFDRERGQSHKAEEWGDEAWDANREGAKRRLSAVLAREFAVPFPTGLGLETVGLAEIVYPGLDELRLPDAVAGRLPSAGARASLAEAWPGVLVGLLDTVRLNRCVTFGDEELDRSAANYPVGRWMSLSATAPNLSSFLPSRSGGSRRTLFVADILRAAGCGEGEAAALEAPLLEAAFGQLLGAARNRTLAWLELGDRQAEGRATVEALRIRFFGLSLRAPLQVFRCPRTGNIWPRTVLGCAPIRGSRGGLEPISQEDLDRHPRVARARRAYREEGALRIGLWADEHSAQLSAEENRRLQELFVRGARNILSATTTMEVGIDIGGLCGVLMANMPPGLANYLQRGGRAGRRTDGSSIVCTFARRQPYDQAAFDDFQSFFTRRLRQANVMLERPGIARRHLQAFLLGEFFQAIRPLQARSGAMDAFGRIGAFCGVRRLPYAREDYVGTLEPEQPIALDVGVRRPRPWWQDGAEPDLAAQFMAFLDHAAAEPGGIDRMARILVAGTGFADEAANWAPCLLGVRERLRDAVGKWRDGHARILEAWLEESRSGARGQRSRMNALSRQDREMRKTTVVEELGNRKFLPRYGFPIGLHTLLVNTEKDDAGRYKLQRDGAIAISEYVPGSVIVVGGQYVRSRGVQRGFGNSREDTVGMTRWRFQCDDGHSHCLPVMDAPERRCGVEGCVARIKAKPERFLVPRFGFASAASDPPSWHGQRQRVGTVDLVINHREGARKRGEMDFGRLTGLRADFVENVELLAANAGAAGFGFAVCTACGYAESESNAGAQGAVDLPPGFSRHLPLFRASGQLCPGATSKAAVLRNVSFAANQFTDLVRFDFTSVPGVDETALVTLGHALALGAAEVLELDQREIRMAADPLVDDRRVARVFDAVGHGGGHMAELFSRADEWLDAARTVLWRSDAHHAKCRTACISCVLSSASQTDAKNGRLDRRLALNVLQGMRVGVGEGPQREATRPAPFSAAQGDMLQALLGRKQAASSRRPAGR
ncbi:DEAD/DEAH box helicase [Roseomonas sp. E05]|uniref:DEAD/DEAH box helicase n=1 Tax=Roseomonas sp. E05 TaxID=3046310 RepID=UPI0024BAEA88|nr:DEAD/DEAH box helicase [Roseomonas sp. E05]MDJ0391153.1 DEAD/DEAH box helicase [Roseomonas sp. E05]